MTDNKQANDQQMEEQINKQTNKLINSKQRHINTDMSCSSNCVLSERVRGGVICGQAAREVCYLIGKQPRKPHEHAEMQRRLSFDICETKCAKRVVDDDRV